MLPNDNAQKFIKALVAVFVVYDRKIYKLISGNKNDGNRKG